LGIARLRCRRAGRHAVIVGLPISVVARALCLGATGDGTRERTRAGTDGGTPTAACYGANARAQQSTTERVTSRVVVSLRLRIGGVLTGPLPADLIVVGRLRQGTAARQQCGREKCGRPYRDDLHVMLSLASVPEPRLIWPARQAKVHQAPCSN